MREKLWQWLKRILFKLDPETAHAAAMRALKLGSVFGGWPIQVLSGTPSATRLVRQAGVYVFGKRFVTPVGLAGGFDKNADAPAAFANLGFGFVEIGTVTPLPQGGNDRPRLFRYETEGNLFNSMGFNNLGAGIVASRLDRIRRQGFFPNDFRVGINIGKNKATSLDDAERDYVLAVAPFEGLVDYVVVNVSSPNTPGLRSLQNSEFMKSLVGKLNQRISAWAEPVALLVKLSPDIRGAELKAIVQTGETEGVDGWILTNTISESRTPPGANGRAIQGGLSGACLRERSRESLRELKSLTTQPVISVGGIDSVEEARERIRLGASLVQIYTGFVYNGPSFPWRVARALLGLPTNQ